MTRITFYVHEQAADTELWICRLLDKIQRQGQQCSVWAPDAAALDSLDRRLWTYSQGSFVAHEQERQEAADAPIILCSAEPLNPQRQTLLLWAAADFSEPPAFFASFSRCLEIVAGEEPVKQAARQRYKFYRDRGYALETHSITPAQTAQ